MLESLKGSRTPRDTHDALWGVRPRGEIPRPNALLRAKPRLERRDADQGAPSLRHAATKCDLLVIDGSHEEHIVSADIANFRHLARSSFHLLLLDDTAACEAEYCTGPNAALADHERRGTVDPPIYAVSEKPTTVDGFFRGMTVTTYNLPQRARRSFLCV